MDEKEVEKKKRGRPKADIQWTSAQRQAQTRGRALSSLVDAEPDIAKELISVMSTSNLIAALPKLMADKQKVLVPLVCNEIIRRVGS